jgi:tetratricopeptide (TPR) repeat protein
VLGCIADAERAAELAEHLTSDEPESAPAFLARARTRAVFHRFSDAWCDLEAARVRGMDPVAVEDERAAIHQAVGRYDEALGIRQCAAERSATFNTLVALAVLHAERREVDAAESLFLAARGVYRGVSPYPLAMLDFQQGHMWLVENDFPRARESFRVALIKLPQYAPAGAHLAEVHARLGDAEAAITLLRPLASASDNPEYAGQLSRFLRDIGRAGESGLWRARAARRYDELVSCHVEAFADHASDFWLDEGMHSDRVVELARINVRIRDTPRARELLARALNACR